MSNSTITVFLGVTVGLLIGISVKLDTIINLLK